MILQNWTGKQIPFHSNSSQTM